MPTKRSTYAAVRFALSLAPAVSAWPVSAKPDRLFFTDDGRIPNSPLPVLVYRNVPLDGKDKAAAFESLFAAHDWPPQWRDGVFDYHHYHSTAHEALGVASGHARLILGGEAGQEIAVEAGDVLILPAGTGHCQIEQSENFLVVGAYPLGQEDYDTQRARPETHDASVERIRRVALPAADPVTGWSGVLLQAWR
ncbi:uncharacterized protein YjlB [Pseudomonas duriflava]|uniref:Uncharacterized protein YjlB n=1 Tax=Pseudomonas duriflava TaxID=459528 RepID=A0A562QLH8_9PSED|nr:cupin domain-containing protein [Pseudomonas duriflava]TWI57607.1 uncharacterized protein YjlB [Pseudomonas duriflava]